MAYIFPPDSPEFIGPVPPTPPAGMKGIGVSENLKSAISDKMAKTEAQLDQTWLDDLFQLVFEVGGEHGAPITERMMEYFGSPRCSDFKLIGSGDHGRAILFTENIVPPRKLILKVGRTPEDDAETLNEMSYLSALTGDPHIVKMIHFDEAVDPNTRVTARPFFLLEYLPNGPLSQLVIRLQNTRTKLPEPVLWSFFLCLTRACIAMDYPANADPSPLYTESMVRKQRRTPSGLRHRDMHLGNFLLGEMDEEFFVKYSHAEHSFAPIIKIIDFGKARAKHADDNPMNGVNFNLNVWGIGQVMATLALGKVYTVSRWEQDAPSQVDVLDRHRTAHNNITVGHHEKVTQGLAALPISQGLRHLILRCKAMDQYVDLQPRLTELEDRCAEAMLRIPTPLRANMRAVMRRLVFDATTMEDTGPIPYTPDPVTPTPAWPAGGTHESTL